LKLIFIYSDTILIFLFSFLISSLKKKSINGEDTRKFYIIYIRVYKFILIVAVTAVSAASKTDLFKILKVQIVYYAEGQLFWNLKMSLKGLSRHI
jgi:hypothetical protein